MFLRESSIESKSFEKAPTLDALLIAKRFDKAWFMPGSIAQSDSIEKISQWVYQFASHPRADGFLLKEHDILHLVRVSFHAVVFANLYRRYGDQEALALTNNDMHLIRIAALLHDIARENDGKDQWDHEHGLLAYYIYRHMGVTHEVAKLHADAITNKDLKPEGYRELILQGDQLMWEISPHDATREKTIQQKVLQCADCLDIMRVRRLFDTNYLDFYKDIAKHDERALNETVLVRLDIERMMRLQGDRGACKPRDIKARYQQKNCFNLLEEMIGKEEFLSYGALYACGQLLDKATLDELVLLKKSDDPIETEMHAGNIAIRMIKSPSVQQDSQSLSKIEFTEMKKAGGNPGCSMTIIGWGASTFGHAGYGLRKLEELKFNVISTKNLQSGKGKKSHDKYMNSDVLSQEAVSTQLKTVMNKQKMGGDISNENITINESKGTIEDADFFVFTRETYDQYEVHLHSAALQARFIRNDYHAVTNTLKPIYEYVRDQNTLRCMPEYKEEEVIRMWVTMCSSYLRTQIPLGIDPTSIPLPTLKVQSMYGTSMAGTKLLLPGDSNESPQLQTKINHALKEACIDIQQEYRNYPNIFLNQLGKHYIDCTSDQVFFSLLHFPQLRVVCKDRIRLTLNKFFSENSEKKLAGDFEDSLIILCDASDSFKLNAKIYYRNRLTRVYALVLMVNHNAYLDRLQNALIIMAAKFLPQDDSMRLQRNFYARIASLIELLIQFDLQHEYSTALLGIMDDVLTSPSPMSRSILSFVGYNRIFANNILEKWIQLKESVISEQLANGNPNEDDRNIWDAIRTEIMNLAQHLKTPAQSMMQVVAQHKKTLVNSANEIAAAESKVAQPEKRPSYAQGEISFFRAKKFSSTESIMRYISFQCEVHPEEGNQAVQARVACLMKQTVNGKLEKRKNGQEDYIANVAFDEAVARYVKDLEQRVAQKDLAAVPALLYVRFYGIVLPHQSVESGYSLMHSYGNDNIEQELALYYQLTRDHPILFHHKNIIEIIHSRIDAIQKYQMPKDYATLRHYQHMLRKKYDSLVESVNLLQPQAFFRTETP